MRLRSHFGSRHLGKVDYQESAFTCSCIVFQSCDDCRATLVSRVAQARPCVRNLNCYNVASSAERTKTKVASPEIYLRRFTEGAFSEEVCFGKCFSVFDGSEAGLLVLKARLVHRQCLPLFGQVGEPLEGT